MADEEIIKREIDPTDPRKTLDTSGFRDVTSDMNPAEEEKEDWDKEKVRELREIHSKLAKLSTEEGKYPLINEQDIKNRIARICLQIMKETPLEKKRMFDRLAVFSDFISFEYGDELDNIFGKMAKLYPPGDEDMQNLYDIWEDIMIDFESYLD